MTLASFVPTEETDGRIALNEDLVPQVFSPYSGRVIRAMARAGDTVKIGDPLLAVQASEFVQVTNDLIAGMATLRTARAQLALAVTNERRLHALFQAQSAAQKDWQQSLLDLATAQGAVGTAASAMSPPSPSATSPGWASRGRMMTMILSRASC